MQVDRTGELVVGVARRVGELLDTIECYCRSISAMWDNHNL